MKDIVWANLKRADSETIYRSICPDCGGFLLVGRDRDTFDLQEDDNCISCGRQFRYTDIETMRAMDRGRTPIILRDV